MLHYFPLWSKWKANLQTHICYIMRSDELLRHFLASLCVLNSPLPLTVVKLRLMFSQVLWTSARNPSRSFRQHRSQWRSPQHQRICSKTAVKQYWLVSSTVTFASLSSKSLLCSWIQMDIYARSEEIHPNWCGHIPGDWMNSVNLSSDLWPAIITVQLMLAVRWKFL